MPQQFTGMMQADDMQQMFTAVPQVMVVTSPNSAGVQYAVPQMMTPTGGMQMPQQMAMQFDNNYVNNQGGGNNQEDYLNGDDLAPGGAQPQAHQRQRNGPGGQADGYSGMSHS